MLNNQSKLFTFKKWRKITSCYKHGMNKTYLTKIELSCSVVCIPGLTGEPANTTDIETFYKMKSHPALKYAAEKPVAVGLCTSPNWSQEPGHGNSQVRNNANLI